MDAIDQCMESGVMDADILSSVQKMLTTSARTTALKTQPTLAQAE